MTRRRWVATIGLGIVLPVLSLGLAAWRIGIARALALSPAIERAS